MNERLLLLVQLQELDREILAIKKNLSRLPEESKKRSLTLESKKERLAKLEQNYRALNLDNEELDLEIKALGSQISRSQEKLLEVRNQREYNAMKGMLASLKADIKHNEDTALDVMGKLEELKASVDSLKSEIAAEEADIEQINSQSTKDLDSARGRINELKDDREKLIALMDPQDYNIYRKSMRPPDFIAVSAVTNPGGLCSACNMQIEPQTLNRLYMGREMVFCSNCARLLYLPEKVGNSDI